jgi:hypothetical protein
MKDDEFVRLTGKILKMDGLTSTDKIVLAYNLGMPRFFASPTHIAATLCMTLSTVKKSIRTLRRLGLWREQASYRGNQAKDTRVSGKGTGVSDGVTRVSDKKSFSPVKTEAGIERILEKNKKEGLDSAAVASPLSHSPQTAIKKLELKTPVTSESQENKISGVSGSEAHFNGGVEATGQAVPLGPTGRPLTKADMTAANFAAIMDGKPEAFTAAQVAAGSDGNPWLEQSAAEFEEVFGRRAG